MPKPTDLPDWATDANYPAGSDPWSGSPTKVEPIAAKQAGGWTPEEPPPAQYLNWWKNLVYQWLAFFAEARTVTLSHVSYVLASGTASFDANAWSISAASSFRAPIELPIGNFITGAEIGYDRGNGTMTFEIVAVTVGGLNPPVATVIHTDNSSSGFQTFSGSIGPIEIEAGKMYYMRVSLTGTTGYLGHTKHTYAF